MASPAETEVKLAASPKVLDELRIHPLLTGEDRTSTLVTTYFDTIGGKLRRGGASLRIRHDGEKREQTLKLSSPKVARIRRGEWNGQPGGDRPDLDAFSQSARSIVTRLLDGAAIEPVATTTIERTTRRIRIGHSAIEVAFDIGKVTAHEREAPMCELELELVEGKLADVLRLASQLPLGPGLGWSVRSKADRSHELAFDLLPSALRAQPLRLASGIRITAGFQTIAWSCLTQLLANYPLVIDIGDLEAFHQSRVAIRRLRAAFSLFGDVVDDRTLPLLRSELKAVANCLGPARDLDVLVKQIANADPDLLRHLDALRSKAVRSAQTMLATAEFQRLLFDFALWIESGDWIGQSQGDWRERELAQFAGSELSRRRRKLKAAAGKIADMSDTKRHRLRINAKKLRYASEFFASVFSDKAADPHRKAFTKALSRLQDSLGELNDIAVASERQPAYFENVAPIMAAKLAAELSEALDQCHKSKHKLLKVAESSLHDMLAVPAWWKPE
jgi:triphosphatase